MLFAIASVVAVSVAIMPAAAGAASIGPAPSGDCATPTPFPAHHAFCVRESSHATVSISTGKAQVGDFITWTISASTPECSTQSPVFPCIDHLDWSTGASWGRLGYRIVTLGGTYFQFRDEPVFFGTDSRGATYFQPFSLSSRAGSGCVYGTVRPSSSPSCTLQLSYSPAPARPLVPGWVVAGPTITVKLGPESGNSITETIEAAFAFDPDGDVENQPPTASFSWEPDSSDPLRIRFDASTSSDDKGITRYEWDFGDGESGTGRETNHRYDEPGTYPARLTVFDAEGLSATTTRAVTVQEGTLTLTLNAETPQPQGVRRTEQIRYALEARVDREASELTLSVSMRPDLVEVDPESISGGGVLSPDGGTIQWTLADTEGTDSPLTFAATVRADVPRSILFISAQASGRAALASGGEARADTLRQTPLIQFGLVLGGELVADRGDHVVPEEVATVRVQADAREQADEIVLEAQVPKGSNLVPGSITGGGVRDGERTIRWRFTDVALTPVVEFKLKVYALDELPKELKRLESKTTAQAVFGGVPESAENTLGVGLVRPTTIRGVVRDIIPLHPTFLAVDDRSPLSGVAVWLRDSSGRVVDETTTSSAGEFALEAGLPGSYTLEARRVTRGRIVPAKHDVALDSENLVRFDGRHVAVVDDALQPVDVYVPVSLVERTLERMQAIRDFRIDYYFVLGFDVRGLLDAWPFTDVTYELAPVEALLEHALALRFSNTDGTRSQYRGLYAGSGDRDGWNALIRMNGFLLQLEKRLEEAVVLADLAARPIALYYTVELVKLLFKGKTPRLAGSQKLWGAVKVGFMAEGIGVIAPWALDQLGIVGQDKAAWMEVIAKGSRYGFNALGNLASRSVTTNTKLPGAWTSDLTFELVFNVMRLSIIQSMIDQYINGPRDREFLGTQRALDDTARRLQLGLYSGSTAEARATMGAIDLRAEARVQAARALLGNLAAGIAAIRGIDGFLGKAGWLRSVTKTTKWLNDWIIGPTLVGMFGTSVIALECQKIEVGNHESVTFDLTDRGTPALCSPLSWIARQARSTETSAGSIDGQTARGRGVAATEPALGSTILRAVEATTRARALVRAGAGGRFRLERQRLMDTYVELIDQLGTLAERAELASPVDPRAAEGLRRVAFARSTVATSALVALTALDSWYPKPTAHDERSGAILALDQFARELRRAQTIVRRMAPRLSSRLPGGMTIRSASEPSSNALVEASPFTYTVTVANPGDRPVAPAVIRLTPGDRLLLTSGGTRRVPALAPGRSVTLTWRLRANAPTAKGRIFLGPLQLALERGGRTIEAVDVILLATR